MEAKEKWINDTLESLQGVRRAEANPFLSEKVLQRLQNKQPVIIVYPLRIAWRIAASVVLLAGINFYTCLHYQRSTFNSKQVNVNSLGMEYFSYMQSDIQF